MFAQIAHDVWIPWDVSLMIVIIIFAVIGLTWAFVAWIDFASKVKHQQMLDDMPMAKTLAEYRHNMALYGVCGYYAEDLAKDLLETEETK